MFCRKKERKENDRPTLSSMVNPDDDIDVIVSIYIMYEDEIPQLWWEKLFNMTQKYNIGNLDRMRSKNKVIIKGHVFNYIMSMAPHKPELTCAHKNLTLTDAHLYRYDKDKDELKRGIIEFAVVCSSEDKAKLVATTLVHKNYPNFFENHFPGLEFEPSSRYY